MSAEKIRTANALQTKYVWNWCYVCALRVCMSAFSRRARDCSMIKHWQELKINAIYTLVTMQHCLDCASDNSCVNCAACSSLVVQTQCGDLKPFAHFERERGGDFCGDSLTLFVTCLTESFKLLCKLFNEEIWIVLQLYHNYFTRA